MSYDTIVIGLGASGTAAATTLARAGRRVLALEAQDRVGGRVRTVAFGDGIVELGAEWIHGTEQSRVYELAVKNNITVLPQMLDFDVFRSDGSEVDAVMINDWIEHGFEVLEHPPETPEPMGQFVTRKLREHVKNKYPQIDTDGELFKEFLLFMDLFVDNHESSDSWNDVSTDTKYRELGGNQHMSWHRHGYKTMFEILLNTYNNGPGFPNLDMKFNTEVTNIAWDPIAASDVTVTCKEGGIYKASNVIFTASLGVLKEKCTTLFTPNLPEFKKKSIEFISYGTVDKIIFKFSTKWWNSKASHFFVWKTVDRLNLIDSDRWLSKLEGLTVTVATDNCIALWVCGDAAKMVSNKKNGHTIFSPPLPKDKVNVINSLSIGVMDKVELLFPYPWWDKRTEFIGFIWRGEEKENLLKSDWWLTKIFGVSTTMGARNVLTVWTSGNGAKLVETLPQEVVKRKAMEVIRLFMGKKYGNIPDPIDMIRSTWYTNPYTRGSYSYDNLSTPNNPNARSILAAPLLDSSNRPRVLFAGEATNNIHFSTVHGALETGYREAERLLGTLSKL